MPALEFPVQLFPAFPGEDIEFRGAAQIGIFPLGADPALLFEPVERRVQRTLANGEDIAGQDLDSLGDAPAMEGLAGDGLQDEQIQGSLEKVGWFGHADTSIIDNIPRLSTRGQAGRFGTKCGQSGDRFPIECLVR